MTVALSVAELTGRARTHVVDIEDPRCTIHREVVLPLRALRAAALRDGIDLVPLSSYRDFERQAAIWNAKYRGERVLLDADGVPLDYAVLQEYERIEAILLWSSLPGASRHHWGTDLDVIDAAAMPQGYVAQLQPAEFAPGGVFARLDAWLAEHAGRFGFFRPYESDRNGVRPEPWHVSYAPIAVPALASFSVQQLAEELLRSDIEGRARVLERLPAIFARYVASVDSPAPETLSEAQAFLT
jgi:LAS superfamily LD-carboxypeptidase LdcB